MLPSSVNGELALTLQAGQILADKYRIVKPIGVGGMGTVYEGENVRIHRRVAIKTLHANVAGKTDVLQRFEREAQAAGRIGSDHIVEVLDMGDLPDGSRYMVMEYLDGTTLGDRIVNQGRIAPRDVVAPLTQLLDGLGAAHNAGIIHRDLKPANVFLLTTRGGRPDFVKILDFGVSKFNILNSDEMSMTRTGAVMGTPYYMSPEQAKGSRAIDMRSDLYSVGVILYESITGQVPFNAETFNELIFKIALEAPPPPEHFVPNLDPAFGALVRKAMGRDPNERFQTAAEMKEALLTWARDYDSRVAMGNAAIGNQGTARTQMLPMVQGAPPQAGVQHAMPMAQQGQVAPQHQAASTLLGQIEAAAQARVSNQHGYPPQEAYPQQQPQKSNAGLFIALGIALVVGAAAGVFFLYSRTPVAEAGQSASSKPAAGDTAKATVTASEPSAQPTAAPTASVELLTTASASSTPSATASETGTAPATAPATVVKTGPRPTGTVPPAATTPTATTKATGTVKGRDIRPDL